MAVLDNIAPVTDPALGFGQKALGWIGRKVFKPMGDFFEDDVDAETPLIGGLSQQVIESRFTEGLEGVSDIMNPQVEAQGLDPQKVADMFSAIQSGKVSRESQQKIQSYGQEYTNLLNTYNSVEKMQDFVFGQGFSGLPQEQQKQHLDEFNRVFEGYQTSRDKLMKYDSGLLKSLEVGGKLKRDTYDQYSKVLQGISNQNKNNEDLSTGLARSFDTFYNVYGDAEKSLAKSGLKDNVEFSNNLNEIGSQTQKVLNLLTSKAKEATAEGQDINFDNFYKNISQDEDFVREFARLDDLRMDNNLAMIKELGFGLDDDTGALGETLQFLQAGIRSARQPVRDAVEFITPIGSDTRAGATSLGQLSYYSDELSKTTKAWRQLTNWADRNTLNLGEFIAEATTSGGLSILGKVGKVAGAAKYLDGMDNAFKANRALKYGALLTKETWTGVTMDSLFNHNLAPELGEDVIISDLVVGALFDGVLSMSALKYGGPSVAGKKLQEVWTEEMKLVAHTIAQSGKTSASEVQILDSILGGKDINDLIDLMVGSERNINAVAGVATKFFRDTNAKITKLISDVGPDTKKKGMKEIKDNLEGMLELFSKHGDGKYSSDVLMEWRKKIRNAKKPEDIKKIANSLSNDFYIAYNKFDAKLKRESTLAKESNARTGAFDTELIKSPKEKGDMFFNELDSVMRNFGVSEIQAKAVGERIQKRGYYTDGDMTKLISLAGNGKDLNTLDWATNLRDFYAKFAKIAPSNISDVNKVVNSIDSATKKIPTFLNKSGISVDFAEALRPEYRASTVVMSTLVGAYGGDINQLVAAYFHEISHGISNFVKNNDNFKKMTKRLAIAYRNETLAVNRLFQEIFGDGFKITEINSLNKIMSSELAKLDAEGARELLSIATGFHKRYVTVEEYTAYSISEYLVSGKINFNGVEGLSDIFSAHLKNSDTLSGFEDAVGKTGILAKAVVKKVERESGTATKDDIIKQAAKSYQTMKGTKYNTVDAVAKVTDFVHDMRNTLDLAGRTQEFVALISKMGRESFIKTITGRGYGDVLEVFGELDKKTLTAINGLDIAGNKAQEDLIKSGLLTTLVLGRGGKEGLLAGVLLEVFHKPGKWFNKATDEDISSYIAKIDSLNQLLSGLATKKQMDEIDVVIGALKTSAYNKAGNLDANLADPQIKRFTNSIGLNGKYGDQAMTKKLEKHFETRDVKFDNISTGNVMYKTVHNKRNTNPLTLRGMTIYTNLINAMPFKAKFTAKSRDQIASSVVDITTGYVTKGEKQTSDLFFSLFNDGKKTSASVAEIVKKIESEGTIEGLKGFKQTTGVFKRKDMNDLFDISGENSIIPIYKAFIKAPSAELFSALARNVYSVFAPKYAEQIMTKVRGGAYGDILDTMHGEVSDSYNKWLKFKSEAGLKDVNKKDIGKFSFMARDDVFEIGNGGFTYDNGAQTVTMVGGSLFSKDRTSQNELRSLKAKRFLRHSDYMKLKKELKDLNYFGKGGLEEALSNCTTR